MKYLKLFLAAIFTVTLINVPVYASAEQNIRIGLYYSDRALDSADLAVDEGMGMEAGYEENGKYKSLVNLNSVQYAVVQKDNYTDATGKGQPAYHVQVGKDIKDYQEAVTTAAKFTEKGYKAFPAFDGEWKVWAGVYKSTIAANADMTKMKKAFSTYTYSIVSPSKSRIQFLSWDKTNEKKMKFIFDTDNKTGSDYKFQVRAVTTNSKVPTIGINGMVYRGAIEFIRQTDSDMTVINTLPLEEYLCSVVGTEMSKDWPLEALKAQALAARTYALSHMNSYDSLGFDMDDTVKFQAYKGSVKEGPNTIKAVNETKGKAMFYNGKLINAFFFSNDGGYTESPENVWTENLPYLKGVEDKYQPADKVKQWTSKVTPAQVKDYFATKGVDIGDILDIKVTQYSKSKNALALKIIGTKGEKEYKKDNIRMFMKGYFKDYEFLYSQTFNLSKDGDPAESVVTANGQSMTITLKDAKVVTKDGVTTITTTGSIYVRNKGGVKALALNSSAKSFTFTGKGWGHGVGMSQWGAYGMAQAGFKADEIVKHYYTGIEIK